MNCSRMNSSIMWYPLLYRTTPIFSKIGDWKLGHMSYLSVVAPFKRYIRNFDPYICSHLTAIYSTSIVLDILGNTSVVKSYRGSLILELNGYLKNQTSSKWYGESQDVARNVSFKCFWHYYRVILLQFRWNFSYRSGYVFYWNFGSTYMMLNRIVEEVINMYFLSIKSCENMTYLTFISIFAPLNMAKYQWRGSKSDTLILLLILLNLKWYIQF